MIRLLIFLILITSQLAGATEFGELVKKYLEVNQQKIESVYQSRQNIIGLEIIVADKASSFASRYGHGLLRLVDNDPYWVNDPVVSFSALSYEKTYSIKGSLTGTYGITPQMLTFHEFWSIYTKEENRDLKRYVINIKKDELDNFLNVLFHYLRAPEELGNYTFLSNNCIAIISKLFIEAGLTANNSKAKIPTNVDEWIEKNQLSVYPEFVMTNFAATKTKLSTIDINKLSMNQMIQTFSIKELNYIYLNYPELSEEKMIAISVYLNEHSMALNDIFNFSPIDQSLYDRCESNSCLKSFAQTEQSKLKREDLLDTIVYRIQSKNKNSKNHLGHLDFKQQKLAIIDTDDFRMRQFEIIIENEHVYIELQLSSTRSVQNSLRQKVKLPIKADILKKNMGRVAVTSKRGEVTASLITLK